MTISVEGKISDAQRAAVDGEVRSQRGTSVWRADAASGRSYALLELPEPGDAAAIAAASGGTVYERPIIALALFPAVSEALSSLFEALGGTGRPAGILACRRSGRGIIVEWDPSITEPSVVIALVDVELRRFGGGHVAQVLSPLPPSMVASIAADGLRAPQISPQRILELRIDGA
jgi:hypothetical protein